MTHTSTEQPWWRAHTDEIERKVACGEMNAATCFTKMLWLVSEASQAQRVPLALYQRDTIKANAWRETVEGGYYDVNAIIDDTEAAHGITQEKQG